MGIVREALPVNNVSVTCEELIELYALSDSYMLHAIGITEYTDRSIAICPELKIYHRNELVVRPKGISNGKSHYNGHGQTKSQE